MTNFIRLRDRYDTVNILLNTEHIVSIKDLRTDKACKDIKSFQFTIVTAGGRSYEVKETEEEIINQITELQ